MKIYNLNLIDLTVIALYFVGMLAVGVYCRRRQKSTKEYFLASGSMGWLSIGISIVATLISTVSYLAVPGEVIAYGPCLLFSYLGYPIAYLIIARVIIPFYLSLNITSAYEYLERRFHVSVRLLGAGLFLVIRLVWMGLVLFTCSMVMVTIAGTPLVPTIIVLGVVTTLYSGLGGIRAIIITDVIQFAILFGGAVITLLVIASHLDGFSFIFGTLHAIADFDYPVISFDPTVRLSIFGMIIWGLAWNICTYGSDQIVIQRYLTVRDPKTVKFSIAVNFIADFLLTVVLALVGLALLAFYSQNAPLLPATIASDIKQNGDKLFSYFIADQLPVGICGLVIAALFAAAMSSLSSGINSITTVVTTDIRQRFFRTTAAGDLRFAKSFSFLIGGVSIVLGCFVSLIKGNFFEIANKSSSCFIGPLFAVFALGVFSRRTNTTGVFIGVIAGIVSGILITYWGQWFQTKSISFGWLIPCSCIISLAAGWLGSFLAQPPMVNQLNGLTYKRKGTRT